MTEDTKIDGYLRRPLERLATECVVKDASGSYGGRISDRVLSRIAARIKSMKENERKIIEHLWGLLSDVEVRDEEVGAIAGVDADAVAVAGVWHKLERWLRRGGANDRDRQPDSASHRPAEDRVHTGCHYCGDRLLPREKDHLIPLGRGGSGAQENIVVACIACNRQKRAMLLYEWKAYRLHNGMPWPPLASHATDPIHYQDHTCGCEKPHVPEYFVEEGDGYIARYRHDAGVKDHLSGGPTYRVGWGVSRVFFEDCRCEFCKHMSAL